MYLSWQMYEVQMYNKVQWWILIDSDRAKLQGMSVLPSLTSSIPTGHRNASWVTKVVNL